MPELRCLTVCQPAAWAILAGLKTAENRMWGTDHTGWLLIHAGKSWEWLEPYGVLRGRGGRPILPGMFAGPPPMWDDGLTPLPLDLIVAQMGKIIGAVWMEGVVGLREAKRLSLTQAEGPLCWHLTRPVPFAAPLPCRGQTSLWAPPAELLPALEAQLPR